MLIVSALVIASVYLLFVTMLWARQERVVFQPPRVATVREAAPPGVRAVEYRSSAGAELVGYLVGDPATSRGVLLAFHGNADLARWLVPWAGEVAHRTGYAVLLPELRGYDNLAGTPTYLGAADDARAALRFALDDLHTAPPAIAFYGHSLGSAIAAELTTEITPRALVLESPFTSARAMAARMGVPGLPALWRLISRVHYDTEARVSRLDTPVFVAHGDRDLIIPAAMGRAVFAAASHKGELLIVPEAGHNDVANAAGEAYWRWLARALAR